MFDVRGVLTQSALIAWFGCCSDLFAVNEALPTVRFLSCCNALIVILGIRNSLLRQHYMVACTY